MRAHYGKPWELRNTSLTLSEIVRRGRARAGTTLIACVDNESQDVLELGRIVTPAPCRGDDDEAEHRAIHALSGELRRIATSIGPERPRTLDGRAGSPIAGTFVTVVCREGRVVSTDVEWQFLSAWRYSNHFMAAFDGDVYVVTPHGWTSTLTGESGYEPALGSGTPLTPVPDPGPEV
ncbi:hypothetical protein [Ornithinimicrobium cavernae]|uniref:hypothetical protein n=1 Tax=Ornithinimicrobium cavernae TaxID=2666047 RepID=UPI0012B1824F|nr:hypothetical protein [Ornithinimicrobium cavernae]